MQIISEAAVKLAVSMWRRDYALERAQGNDAASDQFNIG
jgi:hypothetical protein